MKTDPIPDYSNRNKPNFIVALILVIILPFSLAASIVTCIVNHYYPLRWFISDLLLLLCVGYEVNKYQIKLKEWKRRKQEWLDHFYGKDKEPEK